MALENLNGNKENRLICVLEFIINIILWMISHSLILCFSDDNNFATLDIRKIKEKKVHFRISIINIMLGDYIFYILTFDAKRKKIECAHIICLNDMEGIILTEEKINYLCENFKEHISNLSDNDLQVEKEKLYYHIQNEQSRIDSSLNKLNIYMALILGIIPLFLTKINFKLIFDTHYMLVIICTYALINICVYLYKGICVQGIKKSPFKELRESKNKKEIIVLHYYYDWQQLRYKAQWFVSIVINIQEWIIVLFILSISIYIGVSMDISNENIQTMYAVNCIQYMVVGIENINLTY